MFYQPPSMTLTSRLLADAAEAASRLPRAIVWTVSLAALTIVIGFDLLVGSYASFLPLYIAIAAVMAWCSGERSGLLLALLIAGSSGFVRHQFNVHHMGPSLSLPVELWNGLARLIILCFVVVVVNGLRTAMLRERWQASIDNLTGALNKRAFAQHMAERVKAAQRSGGALLLAYMDLDGFKAVNDAHGHSAGDRILKTFADSAMGAIRSGDAFARIGGDEFAAVLPLRDAADGDALAHVIHRRVSRALEASGLGVTCSMGGLIAEGEQLDASDTYVELVDKLMYEVKRSGKNALRIGRVEPVAATLRTAYPLVENDDFAGLLAAIDYPEAERKRA